MFAEKGLLDLKKNSYVNSYREKLLCYLSKSATSSRRPGVNRAGY